MYGFAGNKREQVHTNLYLINESKYFDFLASDVHHVPRFFFSNGLHART